MNGSVGALIGLVLTPVPLAVGHRCQRAAGTSPVVHAGVRVAVVAVLITLSGAAVASATASVLGVIVAGAAGITAASAAAVDLAELRLPDVLTYTLAGGGVLVAAVGAITGGVAHPWLALLAGGGYGLVMLILALVTPRSGYGLGDVKFAAGLGVWVGLDYPAVAAGALLYGQLLILLTLLISYAAGRRRRAGGADVAAEAPLGPALLAGAALAVLLTG